MNEHNSQVAVVRWAMEMTAKYPELSALYAIPNAAKRSVALAVHMKAEGMRAGIPDLHLPVPKGKYCGLYIEMKYGANKCTELQKLWHERLRRIGHRVEVCYTAVAAIKVIEEYFEGMKPIDIRLPAID